MISFKDKDFELIDQLRDAVSDINWKGPQAIVRARNIAIIKANKVASSIRSNAVKKNIPITTYCRNIIALSEEADIKSWTAFLAYAVNNRKRGFSSLKLVADYLAREKRNQGLLLTLLGGDTKPSNTEIVDFYTEQDEKALEFIITCSDKRYPRTAESLTRRLSHIYRTQKGLRDTIQSDVLAEICKKHKLARLDSDNIAKLQKPLQSSILNCFNNAKHILSSECVAQICKNPHRFPLSPPGRLLQGDMEIVNAIKQRKWDETGIKALLLLYPNKEAENLILHHLKSGRGGNYDYLPDWIARSGKTIKNPQLAQAVKFAALRSNRRFSFFFSLPLKDRADLAKNSSPHDWALSLSKIRDEQNFRRFVNKLARYEIVPSVISEYFSSVYSEYRSKEIDQLALIELARVGQFGIYFKELQQNPQRYADIFLDENQCRDLVDIIIRHCNTPQKLDEFISQSCNFDKSPFKANKLIKTCIETYPKKAVDWLAGIYQAPDILPKLEELIIKSVAQEAIVKVIGPDLTIEAFTRMFDFIPPRQAHKCSALLSLKDNDGSCLWESLLKQAGNTSIPRSLKLALKSANKTVLKKAFLLQPRFFCGAALNKLGLKTVLPTALKNPSVGLYIDRTVERETLRQHIPWARRKWAKQPNVRTAYETALLFSVADGPYLLFLVTRRGYNKKDYQPGKAFDDLYQSYKLPKKAGGNRLISIPDSKLKRLQRRILRTGFEEIAIHKTAHGFLKKRSIATNAKPHAGQEMVINLDISGFFPNTKYPAVYQACRKLAGGKLAPGVARFVADICSYQGALPAGAPTSPHISNIIMQPVDKSLSKVARENGIVYTRYADDLAFSGNPEAKRIIPFAHKVLANAGYALDPKKLNIFRRGRRQIVTGLVVNQKPNIPRHTRKKIRAAVHYFCNGKTPQWHGRDMSIDELVGRLAYLKIVQPKEARKYKSMVKKALRRMGKAA